LTIFLLAKRLDPATAIGVAAAAVQMAQQLNQLKNRILRKPVDRKALLAIYDEARQHIVCLQGWEKDLVGEARSASIELRGVLQDVIDDIEGLKRRKRLVKIVNTLAIYTPQFDVRITHALRTFHLNVSVPTQKQSNDMLASITKQMEELQITKNQLQQISGMDQAIAEVEARIRESERKIAEIKSLQVRIQESLSFIPGIVNQTGEDVRKDRDKTRAMMSALMNPRE
jgi:hypothetical protein